MKSPKSIIRIIICFLVAFLLQAGLGGMAAGESPAGTVGIKGYDPVAYFKEGKALKGSEAYSFRWHDMTWHFRSAGHRDLFETDPEKYAPQYDGYCAWAMTESRKALTNPEVWRIVDGKLYLNCSVDAYEKWIKDIPGNIRKADENWLKHKSGGCRNN